MQFIDQTLRQFLTAAASPRPVPGGGAVAALTGALAATMAEMAANFTLGKKRFLHVQAQVQDLRDVLSRLRSKLALLMDADAEAFLRLQNAQHLPKATTAEIAARQKEVDIASAEASAIPGQVAELTLEVLRSAKALSAICNPKLLSDVGVCAHLGRGAVEAANLNVMVNLRGSIDVDRQDAEADLCRRRMEEVESIVAEIAKVMETRGATGSPAETGMFDSPIT